MKSTPLWKTYEGKWGLVALAGMAIFCIALLAYYVGDLSPRLKDDAHMMVYIGGTIVFFGVMKMFNPPSGLDEDSSTF
mgnify:FL=1